MYVQKILGPTPEEDYLPCQRRYPAKQRGKNFMIKLMMTILQMMTTAVYGQQLWQQESADIFDTASDTIHNICGLEIDNMQGDASLQQIPVWRRKTMN